MSGSTFPKKTISAGDMLPALEHLEDSKEVEVLTRYFGFGCERENMEQIAASFDPPVSRARIWQIKTSGVSNAVAWLKENGLFK